MELALALTGMTVGEMLERMTDRELDGWVAYARKHGLPQKRQELYLAQVAQVGGGGKLETYVLRSGGEREEEQVATLAGLAKVGGANVHYVKVEKG